MGKPQGRIPLGQHRRRWEDNIKIGVKKKNEAACTGFF
jgi:hypothetical protein